MTRKEVLVKAIEGRISWVAAADILGVTPRHMRRLRQLYETTGYDGLVDHRAGKSRRKRIPVATIRRLCELRRRPHYAELSIQHFWEHATEKHGLRLSYTWTRVVLQAAGLAPKAPARGTYRRKRERRPMVGMLIHLDASTHRWLPEQPAWDLVVALDDADGRILYARFVAQEGVASTFAALSHVLQHYGRFAELSTDRAVTSATPRRPAPHRGSPRTPATSPARSRRSASATSWRAPLRPAGEASARSARFKAAFRTSCASPGSPTTTRRTGI